VAVSAGLERVLRLAERLVLALRERRVDVAPVVPVAVVSAVLR
jgi:hypothetical protein